LAWSRPNAYKNNVPHILHHWKEVLIKKHKSGVLAYMFSSKPVHRGKFLICRVLLYSGKYST